MSPKAVSFTPERTKQPPRAWERRPATPFVPRDDKQKIWKRVPLGEIGIEPNRPANISRREQEATKDYVRVVKKLKVGHGSDDEDKENASAGAKTDVEDKDLKRRVRFDSCFVTMKTEEDVIQGSPKKKLRTVMSEPSCNVEEQVSEKVRSEDGEEETVSADEDEAMGSIHQAADEEQYEQDSLDASNQENTEPGTEKTGEIPQEHPNHDDRALEENSDASSCEGMAAGAHGPGNTSNNTLSGGERDVEPVVDSTTQMQEMSDEAFSAPEQEVPQSTDLDDQELPAQTMELDQPLDTAEQPSIEMGNGVVEHTEVMAEEPRSSSPPTVLAENVIVDELESREVSKLDASTDQPDSSDILKQSQESGNTKEQEPTSRRVSDDEAAFLRNFVSTSKAERAAREKQIQETLFNELTEQQDEPSMPQTQTLELSEEVLQPASGTNLEFPPPASIENASSSPLRRSKRAVITSIPRPQTLPNAIQLKRANGNEFIFTANKATSAVNVAVVTRSNTKRNKGSALIVPERLQQLSTGEHGEVSGDVNETVDNVDDKVGSKKRKRAAKDGGVRVKKVLRWNDENLVSYQEAERNVEGWEDIDDSSQENNALHEAGDSDKHVKLTLTLNGNSTQNSLSTKDTSTTPKSSTKDAKETSTSTSTSSQNKLRKVRRGTSGTVNGTPGPKTRSRRVTEDENNDNDTTTDGPIDTNGSVEDSTAVTVAINNLAATTEGVKGNGPGISKKSRMPMPVASGLGVRRGAAASASIRGTTGARGVGAVAGGTGEVKKGREVGKMQTPVRSEKDDGKGDLLGKRRLRVRP